MGSGFAWNGFFEEIGWLLLQGLREAVSFLACDLAHFAVTVDDVAEVDFSLLA